MGWLAQLFGIGAREPEPEPEPERKPVGRDFEHGQLPGDHQWTEAWRHVGEWGFGVPIAGIQHRADAAYDFTEQAKRAEDTGGSYGILLEREPKNPHDRNAVRVLGWIGESTRAKHIGYLPREAAGMLVKEYPRDVPIAGELRRAFIPPSGRLWLGIKVYVPADRDPWWRERGRAGR